MKIYVVGGAVRDIILGKEPKDIDYCVTNSSPDEMIELGYIPIEATSFPVFHDKDHNEFALARTEHKTGEGYHGFECNFDRTITIEEDLYRRDLTINSMAVELVNWETFKITKCPTLLIDPYNGRSDILNKIIHNTSKHFEEDPVRILRAIRLSNRLEFGLSVNINATILRMIRNGMIDQLTVERIWLEFAKVFNDSPSIHGFFNICDKYDIFDNIFRNINGTEYQFKHSAFVNCIGKSKTVENCFVSMMSRMDPTYVKSFCSVMKLPKTLLQYYNMHYIVSKLISSDMSGAKIVDSFNKIDIKHNKDMFDDVCKFVINEEPILTSNVLSLEIYYNITNNITFATLGGDEQKSLKGPAIKSAIDDIKIDIIDKIKQLLVINS